MAKKKPVATEQQEEKKETRTVSNILNINFDVNAVEDSQVLPKDEYRLEIVASTVKLGKESGNPYIALTLISMANPAADAIFHNLMIPGDKYEERTNVMFMRNLKNFAQAFDIEFTPETDVETFKGKTGWAMVDVEKDNNDQDRNVIKRFIAKR